jgi:5-methylcytosine-specific restriction endonuclease McrBC regulatory subunit McrC
VTTYWDKQIDFVIAQIIYQALQILKSDFEIGKINVPDSAQEAINHISNEVREKEFIGEHEYKTIRYKEIYMSWKPVVDLSWDIIKRKQLSLKQKQAHQGLGFFIDMAEVWEQYLRAILKKALSPYGWSYRSEEQMAYKGLFFQRRLIPDLVFQKGDYVAVWDAKYKRMLGRPFDVDRSDFFQIHTYIQNFMFPHRVKAGGLLYPISILGADFKKYSSPNLISERGANVNFAIDGIELNENHGETDMRISKEEFIGRIVSRLS